MRLESYLETLEQFEREQRQFATSSDLGVASGITPEKVRQDLFGLGSAGRPRVGYEITHLIKLLREVFDLNREKSACIVGCGNLGRALAHSSIWSRSGYKLVAIFDNNPAVVGEEHGGLRIRNITELFGVVRNEDIEMAVLTVPAAAAQDTADLLVAAGIRAIWNFAQSKLQTREGIVVENQSLALGLITLSQRTKQA
jgi:redox-sensing transcriptional repressor